SPTACPDSPPCLCSRAAPAGTGGRLAAAPDTGSARPGSGIGFPSPARPRPEWSPVLARLPVTAVGPRRRGPHRMSDAPERTRAVLAGMGAPESLAGPLVGALGPGAAEELAEDPWRLLALPSITPDQADYCRSEEHTSELQSRETLVCR